MIGEGIQDVNIELGDDVSKMLYEASKATHQNRPGLLEEFHESFSGARAIPLSYLGDTTNLFVNMDFDGVGTKVEISERLRDHSVVPHDLFAMACDDAVVRGAETIAIGSILDVRHLNDTEYTRTAVEQLAHGYVEAAREAGVVVVNGEVAELGDRIGGYRDIVPYMKRLVARILHREITDNNFNYNWGAAALWVAHKDKILTGHQIEPGHTLVGIQENGFRSNGITDVRKAMVNEYGREWHLETESSLGKLTLGQLVQQPSVIYSRLITDLTGGYAREAKANITGVAHITGGGQPSKLKRMLEPSGYGAIIDTPLDPPAIMTHVQELRGFDDRTAYGKWHMGPGMVVATTDPEIVIEEARQQGKVAKVIGAVTDSDDIRILNRGAYQKEEWVDFPISVF